MFLVFCSRIPLDTLIWHFTLVSLALHSAFQLKPLALCAYSRSLFVFPRCAHVSHVALVSLALRSFIPLCAYNLLAYVHPPAADCFEGRGRMYTGQLIVHYQEMLQIIFNPCVSISNYYISLHTSWYKLYYYLCTSRRYFYAV